MKKILPILILVALIAAVTLWLNGDDSASNGSAEQIIPEGEAIDVVNAFYGDWLAAQVSTSTDPYTAGLAADPRLSAALQARLVEAQAAEQDPVLCQTTLPERTGARMISQTDFTAEAQVLARGLPERSSIYALVSLAAVDGEWQIADIVCEDAAAAPAVGEFSFDKEGYLLKSVPEPLNSDFWHLVFTEDTVPGHTAPLFFDAESTCVAVDGTETVCNPDVFTEPSRAQVQGAMTEAGVAVARIVFE